jgi:DNA ligase 1
MSQPSSLQKVCNLFYWTSNTSSSLEKIKICEEFIQNADNDCMRYLRFYLDPDITFGFSKNMIKKVAKVSLTKKSINSIEFLERLANRDLTGNDALVACRALAEQLNYEEEKALIAILTKKPVGFNEKTFNKAYQKIYNKNFIEIFVPQLANKYSNNKDYRVDYWWVSPKLDGIRCVYRSYNLKTRSNKEIVGFENITKVCNDIAKKFDTIIIDGELYSHTLTFQEIQGFVVRSKNINSEDKEKIFFNIFAVTSDSIKDTAKMVELLHKIESYLKTNNITCVRIIPYEKVKNEYSQIEDIAKKYVENGYEGCMLRHPFTYYDFKRSDNLLKVKFFIEDDFRIIGFKEGDGRNKNLLGSVIVESIDKRVVADVGSGFSDEDRKYIWSHKDEYIDKLAEVKYQNLTDDGSSLRFPIWTGKLKLDR